MIDTTYHRAYEKQVNTPFKVKVTFSKQDREGVRSNLVQGILYASVFAIYQNMVLHGSILTHIITLIVGILIGILSLFGFKRRKTERK